MGNARNVGGMRARCGRTRPIDPHYLTAREAGEIARRARAAEEERGIFRRWNDRQLTPEQQQRATEALQKPRRRRRPRPSSLP